ncbi:MAG: hypothetical protein MRZ34_01760 [Bacillales bacterium]|nr:hypothetical protein [Bacillales bacterium]
MEEKKPRFFDFEKVNETLKEEKPKVDNTFNKVFNTIEKKEDKKEATPTFEQVFHTGIKKEEVKEKKEEVVNSSKFFNTTVEITTPEVKVETPSDDYVEKVGDNPMVDYDRINSSYVEEEKPALEIIEETDLSQSNNNVTRNRINISGSDLMKLRMQRK